MKNSIRMILTLVIVGSVSGIILTSVYNYANPLIEENRKKALEEAIVQKVLTEAAGYNKMTKEEIVFYEGIDEKGNVIGYVFIGEGNGYQGTIKIIAALDTRLEKLKGIEVLESSETPGLGGEITKDSFKDQFRGLSVLPEITFTKEEASQDNEIQAITGATISTRSVVEILNKEITRMREILGH